MKGSKSKILLLASMAVLGVLFVVYIQEIIYRIRLIFIYHFLDTNYMMFNRIVFILWMLFELILTVCVFINAKALLNKVYKPKVHIRCMQICIIEILCLAIKWGISVIEYQSLNISFETLLYSLSVLLSLYSIYRIGIGKQSKLFLAMAYIPMIAWLGIGLYSFIGSLMENGDFFYIMTYGWYYMNAIGLMPLALILLVYPLCHRTDVLESELKTLKTLYESGKLAEEDYQKRKRELVSKL